jgi:ATP-binding cassette subfamily B protein
MARIQPPKTLKDSAPRFWLVLRRLWPGIRKQLPLVLAAFLALVAQIFLRLLEPWPLKFIIDELTVAEPGETQSGIPAVDALDPMALLTFAALAVVVIALLRAATTYFSTVSLALAGNRVLTEVRSSLYQHLLRLSLSYHTRARSGDLITRLTGDVGRLQEVAVTALLPLLVHFLTLVCMVVLMLLLNWKLALLGLAAFPFLTFSMVRLSGNLQKVARDQRQREGALAATAAEAIGAIKVVQALSLEGTLESTFARQNKKSFKEGVKGKRLSARLERTVDVLTAIGTALVLWYGARLVLSGTLTPGDLIVFLSYLKATFRPTRNLAKYTGRIAKATASGERVLDVLETAPEIQCAPDARPAPAFDGTVSFVNVSFAYAADLMVLRGIHLHVRCGERVALVGPSGGGKSTLVSLILRLYDPVRGRILIDGNDIRQFTLASLRAQISIVLQESVLFAVSVRDNIAYGSLDAKHEEIGAAARLANAHKFIEALPEGYDTILGERGATLSGGQRQRIAIARAALRRAPIVILDEPATGLDEENQQMVQEALDRLTQDRTVFMIAHDMRTAERADRILYLDGGRALESGTHQELMRLGGRYAAMYLLQEHASNGRRFTEEAYALTS